MDEILIIDADGNQKNVNFITTIFLEKYNSTYLAYLEGEISDENVVCFAKIKEENGKMFLDNITNEDEFSDLRQEFGKELYK